MIKLTQENNTVIYLAVNQISAIYENEQSPPLRVVDCGEFVYTVKESVEQILAGMRTPRYQFTY